jgi:hypothetical protein
VRSSTHAARIASTPALGAPAHAATTRFASTAVVVPAAFRAPMMTHELAASIPAPSTLRELTARLRGRLAVVNPVGAACLGPALGDAIAHFVSGACDGSLFSASADDAARSLWQPWPSGRLIRPNGVSEQRAARARRIARLLRDAASPDLRQRVARGVSSVGLALYESASPSVSVTIRGTMPGEMAPLAQIDATIRYRFAIVLFTARAARDWREVDDAVTDAPALQWSSDPWFTTRRLVPDAWIASHADPQSLARWTRVTGRGGTADAYWYPATWERFLESGVRVGYVTPMDVWRSRRSQHGTARASGDDLTRSPFDVGDMSPSFSGASRFGASRFGASPFDAGVERGLCVPPGYGLADCRGMLEIGVVAL